MTEAATTDAGSTASTDGGEQQQEQKTFTQAEVDALIKERADRIAKQRYSDYDELKTKAEGAKTLEERLGSLEAELSTTKAEALRASIAARFGVSTEKGKDGEPSDADLFLTGTDESTLTAQAQRLAARQVDLKKQGNVARNEGETKTTGTSDEVATRELAAKLFGGSD